VANRLDYRCLDGTVTYSRASLFAPNQYTKSRGRKGALVLMANTTGSDLLCRICGLEVKVTKGGTGIVRCCGEPMAVISEQK